MFDNENESPFKILLDSCKLIQDLNEVIEGSDVGLRVAGTSFWSPPLIGVIKLNFDGSFFCEDEVVGVGVVF